MVVDMVSSEVGNPKAMEINQHQGVCNWRHHQPCAERNNKLFTYVNISKYIHNFFLYIYEHEVIDVMSNTD